MAKSRSPSRGRSRVHRRSNAEEDIRRRRASESHDDRKTHSRFPSEKSRLDSSSRHEKGKSTTRKRPHLSSIPEERSSDSPSDSRPRNESNAEKYERASKKRAGSGERRKSSSGMNSWEKGSSEGTCVNSWKENKKRNTDHDKGTWEKKGSASDDGSNSHSSGPWDCFLKRETNVDEGNNMDGKSCSASGDLSNSHSSGPWDCFLKRETNVDEGNIMKGKSSSSGDLWNSHSSWPSSNSWLEKERNSSKGKNVCEETWSASKGSWNSHSRWPSWPQKKSGVEGFEDTSQNRVSSSRDHGGSHSHRRRESRLEKRSDFGKDKALVYEGGHNSSDGASRLEKTIAKETKDQPWKSLNNSSDRLQLSSSSRVWKSALQVRNNAEEFKNILEERTSKLIKRYKEDDSNEDYSTKDRLCKRAQVSEDGAILHSNWPSWESKLQGGCDKGGAMDSPGNSCIREENNVDAASMKPDKLMPNRTDHSVSPLNCASQDLKIRSKAEHSDGFVGRTESTSAAESPVLPSQNSDVRKKKNPDEVKVRFREKAVDLSDQPSTDMEEKIIKDADEARDVPNEVKKVNGESLSSHGEKRNRLEKEKVRPNEVAFDETDGGKLPRVRDSSESRTLIESKEGSKDGLPEQSKSSWASWKCTERRKNDPKKGNDTASERAFIIDATELPSVDLGMMQRGKEQENDGSVCRSHESDVQRSNIEEPKGIHEESRIQIKCTQEEPKDRSDEKTVEVTNGAEFPSMLPCLESELQRSISVQEIEVSPREQTNDPIDSILSSKDKKLRKGKNEDATDRRGVKAPTSIDGSPNPPTPCDKHSNSLPKSTKTTNCHLQSRLHISRGVLPCPGNCPAKKGIWKGTFKVTDIASVVRVYEGFSAHPSSNICRRAYEFSKNMLSSVEFLVQPRCNYWPTIFKDCPDTDDIALYFYPMNNQATRQYASLLKFIDSKDLMLRSEMGQVELLVFPSRLLNARCQTIKNHYFFWGVFRAKKQARRIE